MTRVADVVVIGAGVTGASIAFNLAKSGVTNVVVLEKNTICSGATGRSSACIRQHYSTEITARMVHRSLAVFENFDDLVGGSAGFVRTGYLMGVPERNLDALKKVLAMQRKVGIKTQLVSPSEIKAIEPRVRTDDFAGGAWEPDSGYADPSDTTASFLRRARELGVEVRQGAEVVGLGLEAGRVAEVRTPSEKFLTNTVVDAAGAWGDRVARLVGVEIDLTVCRHNICFVKRPETASARHAMFYDFVKQIYTRPEGRDLTLVGSLDPVEVADVVDPDRYDHGISYDKTVEMTGQVTHRFPPFEAGSFHSGYSGFFDVTPDWHPILDVVPHVSGFYLAVGFSGHGFKLAPAVGEMVCSLIMNGKAPDWDIAAFGFSRFAENNPIVGMYDGGLMG